jgi:hypothetical protein
MYDLQLTWTDASHISVAPGGAVDSTNAVNMALAAATTINTGVSGLGGMDYVAGAGTASATSSATLTGSGTSFLTAFGTRALTGTITTTGTAAAGTGTKFFSQLAVNDLIGNATLGYFRVTAIASDTACTLSGSLSATGATLNCIEQPYFSIGSSTAPLRAIAIANNTSLTMEAPLTVSGAFYVGLHGGFPDTDLALSYVTVFLVVQSGTVGVVLSNQRTVPYLASVTSYRAIGVVVGDATGLQTILNFTQRGNGRQREMFLNIANNTNGNRVVNGGTASAAWTAFVASAIVPPSATDVMFSFNGSSSTAFQRPSFLPRMSSYPAGEGAHYTVSATTAVDASAPTSCPCDGAQGMAYYMPSANATLYVDVYGWRESW